MLSIVLGGEFPIFGLGVASQSVLLLLQMYGLLCLAVDAGTLGQFSPRGSRHCYIFAWQEGKET